MFSFLGDFPIYYLASVIAREHQGTAIYSGIEDGQDPVLKEAIPGSAYSVTASRLGLGSSMQPYIYPPTFADMLIPFTFLPVEMASSAWKVANLTFLLGILFLTIKLLGIRPISLAAFCVFIALFTAMPAQRCIFDGQVTILLLLLWISGIYFYRMGWIKASAFVLALATAIKLTPLIAVIAFLVWREWRWLRAFIASLIALAFAICLINSPAAIDQYIAHILPAMGRAFPEIRNWTVASDLQLLYVAIKGGRLGVVPLPASIPTLLTNLGKLCSTAILALSVLLAYRRGPSPSSDDRSMTLALFAMLSPAIAPVSWLHAYVACFVGLCLLWANAFRDEISNARLILLTLASIILNSFVLPGLVVHQVEHSTHMAWTVVLASLLPLSAIALTMMGFSEMGRSHQTKSPTTPSTPPVNSTPKTVSA